MGASAGGEMVVKKCLKNPGAGYSLYHCPTALPRHCPANTPGKEKEIVTELITYTQNTL